MKKHPHKDGHEHHHKKEEHEHKKAHAHKKKSHSAHSGTALKNKMAKG